MKTQSAQSFIELHGIAATSAKHDSVLTRVTAAVAAVAAEVATWHRNERAIAELKRMDDRMLSDIGVSRGAIERTVRKGR